MVWYYKLCNGCKINSNLAEKAVNKNTIHKIISDFDVKAIPPFFDLEKYEADYEVSRHLFKALRIRYIVKSEVKHPEKAIYVNFHKKYFSVSIFRKVIAVKKEIFQDDYQNYDAVEDIYNKLQLICKNKEYIADDELIFDKLDGQIEKYSEFKGIKYLNSDDYNEKKELFWVIHTQLVNLEKDGKIAREKGKKPINYLQQIIENDGPEFCYTIKFRPIWNDMREYQIGVCVRGEPLLKKLK